MSLGLGMFTNVCTKPGETEVSLFNVIVPSPETRDRMALILAFVFVVVVFSKKEKHYRTAKQCDLVV